MTKDTNRWIALSVEMFDHPVVGVHLPPPKAADPARHSWQPMVAWQWMLIRTAYKPHTPFVKGRPIKLSRGQLVMTSRFLAENANWGHKAARVFLDRLALCGMVSLSTAIRDGQLPLDFDGPKKGTARGTVVTIVTICNYDKYQHKLHVKGHSQGHNKGTAGAQVTTKGTKDTKDNGVNLSTLGVLKKDQRDFSENSSDDSIGNVVQLRNAPAYEMPPQTRQDIEALGLNPDTVLARLNAQLAAGAHITRKSGYLWTTAVNQYAEANQIAPAIAKAMVSRNPAKRQAAFAQATGTAAQLSETTMALRRRASAPTTDPAALLKGLKA